MNKLLIGSALGIFVIAGAFFFLTSKQKISSIPNPSGIPTSNEESGVAQSPSDSDRQMLLAGGSSYADTQGAYTVLYPNDYVLDAQDEKHVRIYKRAETVRPQGEITDGVLMVFETVELDGQTLEKVVDSQIQQAIVGGTAEVITPKRAITVNSYTGFTYELSGFGGATHVILQKNPESSSAVKVTYSVMDPNKKGYDSEVKNILSTLQLQ